MGAIPVPEPAWDMVASIPMQMSGTIRYENPEVQVILHDQIWDLLADRQGGEAMLIDPVAGRVAQYLQLIEELDLKLEINPTPINETNICNLCYI